MQRVVRSIIIAVVSAYVLCMSMVGELSSVTSQSTILRFPILVGSHGAREIRIPRLQLLDRSGVPNVERRMVASLHIMGRYAR